MARTRTSSDLELLVALDRDGRSRRSTASWSSALREAVRDRPPARRRPSSRRPAPSRRQLRRLARDRRGGVRAAGRRGLPGGDARRARPASPRTAPRAARRPRRPASRRRRPRVRLPARPARTSREFPRARLAALAPPRARRGARASGSATSTAAARPSSAAALADVPRTASAARAQTPPSDRRSATASRRAWRWSRAGSRAARRARASPSRTRRTTSTARRCAPAGLEVVGDPGRRGRASRVDRARRRRTPDAVHRHGRPTSTRPGPCCRPSGAPRSSTGPRRGDALDHRGRLRRRVPLRPRADRRDPGAGARPRGLRGLGQQGRSRPGLRLGWLRRAAGARRPRSPRRSRRADHGLGRPRPARVRRLPRARRARPPPAPDAPDLSPTARRPAGRAGPPPARRCVRPGASAGLHVLAWLPDDVDEAAVVEAAAGRGHRRAAAWAPGASNRDLAGLIFGYGAITEGAIEPGVARLAAIIASARRPPSPRRRRSARDRGQAPGPAASRPGRSPKGSAAALAPAPRCRAAAAGR